jgi:hypothetical protein
LAFHHPDFVILPIQIEPDTEGILEEGEDFTEFRSRVVELIKDVVFIIGSSNVFRHMLAHLVSLPTASFPVEPGCG